MQSLRATQRRFGGLKESLMKSFVTIPYKTISDIYAFLGLRDESSAILEVRRWKIHKYDSEIRNMNDRSFVNLSLQDIKKIEAVAGEMLDHYGYQRLSGAQREDVVKCSRTE